MRNYARTSLYSSVVGGCICLVTLLALLSGLVMVLLSDSRYLRKTETVRLVLPDGFDGFFVVVVPPSSNPNAFPDDAIREFRIPPSGVLLDSRAEIFHRWHHIEVVADGEVFAATMPEMNASGAGKVFISLDTFSDNSFKGHLFFFGERSSFTDPSKRQELEDKIDKIRQ